MISNNSHIWCDKNAGSLTITATWAMVEFNSSVFVSFVATSDFVVVSSSLHTVETQNKLTTL